MVLYIQDVNKSFIVVSWFILIHSCEHVDHESKGPFFESQTVYMGILTVTCLIELNFVNVHFAEHF